MLFRGDCRQAGGSRTDMAPPAVCFSGAGPAVIFDQLRTMGLKDKDVATLAGYGSLATLDASKPQWQVALSLNEAKAAQVIATIKQWGL